MNAPQAFYVASPVKRRRSTKAEVTYRRAHLLEIAREMKPMTVRQVFYQATVAGLIDKTEAGYNKVQTDLVWLRRQGIMPYGWLTDSTRWQRRPTTFSNIEEALANTAKFYRKSLWADAACDVEIWLEKDALAGVIHPITDLYDVPLMVARGYASLTFLHSAAEQMAASGVPTFVYHFGDYDPSGVNAAEKIDQTLRQLAPRAEIHFQRMAVTPAQIRAYSLQSRPTKATDSRSKSFSADSVELDAMPPSILRGLVERVINWHLPQHEFEVLRAAEQSERRILEGFTRTFASGAAGGD